ncbi:MAG: rhodanese-like domain-containing protein [Terracidiphilus sp.]
MDWKIIAVVAAVLAVFLLLKRAGLISAKAARELLRQGALTIDVRTEGEFAAGHLPRAINLPLDQIETALPRRVADKDKPLLLHCASGMRSGAAKAKLKALGYTNAHNLGSYARAARIVQGV